MKIALPPALLPFSDAFARAGVPAYVVGGFVRNALLSLPPADIDLCSALPPERVSALFSDAGAHVIEKAPELGTVEIHFFDLSVEHTTFRAESYAAGGAHRPRGVRFSDSLPDDAFRRDFTVNALYADLATGEITDPTGGLPDLSRRMLRATGPDPAGILSSDALRVLRLVRLSAELGFMIDGATLSAARENASGLADISAERRRDELNRILLADVKYGRTKDAVLTALHTLDALGAWAYLIPELIDGRGMEQRKDVHRYTVMEHMLHACAEAPPELACRLSGLLHDVGKPRAFAETGRYLIHDRVGEKMTREILTRLRYPNETVETVSRTVKNHMYDIQGTAREKTLRIKFVSWGRDFTKRMIAMRETDIRGCGTDSAYVCVRWRDLLSRMEREGVPFSLRELAVTGDDLMQALDIPPSPAVGRALKKLLLHCATRPRDNTKQRLLGVARSSFFFGEKERGKEKA